MTNGIHRISVKCHRMSTIDRAKPSRYSARCSLNVTGDSNGFFWSMVDSPSGSSFRCLFSREPQRLALEVVVERRGGAAARRRVERERPDRRGEISDVVLAQERNPAEELDRAADRRGQQ